MAIYSRALKHIDMNRVKELREEKIENKRIIEQCRNEIRQELLNAHNPEYSNWRHEVQNLDENMTSSGLFQTTLQGQGDIDLIDVATDAASWPIESNNEASNSFGSGSGSGTLGGFASESGAMIQIGGETAWNSAATSSALDLSRVDTIRVQGIAGNNFNGGIAPAEDLVVYFYTADLNSFSSTQVAVPKTTTSLTNYEVTIPEEFRRDNMKVSFFTDTYENGQGIHYKPFTIPINGLNHATIGSIPVGAGSATGVNNYIAGKILGSRSDSNMRDLGYYLWENIQRAKNGASVGPNPNYGQPGEGEFIYLDNWDPSPVSGAVNSSQSTDADYIYIGRAVYDMFKGNKLYGLSEVSFKRRTPMNVVVALDDPEATSFIRTDPYFEGLTPEEKKKKLEEMLKAGDEYLLKMFGEDFPGSGNADIVGPGVEVTDFDGNSIDPADFGDAPVPHDLVGDLALLGITYAAVKTAFVMFGPAIGGLIKQGGYLKDLLVKGKAPGKFAGKAPRPPKITANSKEIWNSHSGKYETIKKGDPGWDWAQRALKDTGKNSFDAYKKTGEMPGGIQGWRPLQGFDPTRPATMGGPGSLPTPDVTTPGGGAAVAGGAAGGAAIGKGIYELIKGAKNFFNKKESIEYDKETILENSTKKLKKPKEFFNKADIKPVFPETPPPKMINGRHPDWVDGEKVSNRYNRLDPISAKAMPPTGNPHIDKKVRAAAKKPK